MSEQKKEKWLTFYDRVDVFNLLWYVPGAKPLFRFKERKSFLEPLVGDAKQYASKIVQAGLTQSATVLRDIAYCLVKDKGKKIFLTSIPFIKKKIPSVKRGVVLGDAKFLYYSEEERAFYYFNSFNYKKIDVKAAPDRFALHSAGDGKAFIITNDAINDTNKRVYTTQDITYFYHSIGINIYYFDNGKIYDIGRVIVNYERHIVSVVDEGKIIVYDGYGRVMYFDGEKLSVVGVITEALCDHVLLATLDNMRALIIVISYGMSRYAFACYFADGSLMKLFDIAISYNPYHRHVEIIPIGNNKALVFSHPAVKLSYFYYVDNGVLKYMKIFDFNAHYSDRFWYSIYLDFIYDGVASVEYVIGDYLYDLLHKDVYLYYFYNDSVSSVHISKRDIDYTYIASDTKKHQIILTTTKSLIYHNVKEYKQGILDIENIELMLPDMHYYHAVTNIVGERKIIVGIWISHIYDTLGKETKSMYIENGVIKQYYHNLYIKSAIMLDDGKALCLCHRFHGLTPAEYSIYYFDNGLLTYIMQAIPTSRFQNLTPRTSVYYENNRCRYHYKKTHYQPYHNLQLYPQLFGFWANYYIPPCERYQGKAVFKVGNKIYLFKAKEKQGDYELRVLMEAEAGIYAFIGNDMLILKDGTVLYFGEPQSLITHL